MRGGLQAHTALPFSPLRQSRLATDTSPNGGGTGGSAPYFAPLFTGVGTPAWAFRASEIT
jgi:hypothetical protein